MKSRYYIPPLILQSVSIGLEVSLLGSVIDNVDPAKGIESTGQDHHELDFGSSSSTFNTSWEETGHV